MQPHIRLDQDSRYSRVLSCGSPERAEKIAGKLTGSKKIAQNREYHSFLGQYEGKDILVTSHGVGSAGAAICFQELIKVGARTIIRLGTAGGLYDETQVGDWVIATSAVRQDGVSSLMIPLGYPAIADSEITLKLTENAKKTGHQYKAGIIVSSDIFYPGLLDTQLALYAKAGVHAVEMECSTLFVIGSLSGIKTGGIVVLDGNPLKWSDGKYDPHGQVMADSIDQAIKVALSTLAH
ncbi:MAG: nucleoside phosphorylase [Xanthomonadaceae bacterium]|nr:nucleoside phosphorylase [Xanthomonadaceae bacterium]